MFVNFENICLESPTMATNVQMSQPPQTQMGQHLMSQPQMVQIGSRSSNTIASTASSTNANVVDARQSAAELFANQHEQCLNNLKDSFKAASSINWNDVNFSDNDFAQFQGQSAIDIRANFVKL